MDAETTPRHTDPGPRPERDPDDHRYVWPKGTEVADRWRWPRRIFFTVALLGAAAFVVYAFDRAPNNVKAANLDPAIVRQEPIAGSHVLHQAQVGLVLQQGYDGRITIDGNTIPEDEMDNAIPTSSPLYDPRLGPRPNDKNQVLYTPAAGKVLDGYPPGVVTISVRYWKIADGEGASRTLTWTINVN